MARAVPNKLRRNYVPGGPLFAQRPFKFRGAPYKKHDELPVAEMSKARHWRLWFTGMASHVKYGPFDRRAAKTTEPAAVEQPAAAEQPSEVTEPALELPVATDFAPSDDPPPHRRRRPRG